MGCTTDEQATSRPARRLRRHWLGAWALAGLGVCGMGAGLAATAAAQSIPGAVLAAKEPRHRLAYQDSTLRVLRVEVPPRDSTLLHEHAVDYFWIALGESEVVNARQGAPEAAIFSRDLAIRYTAGKFAHVARNPGPQPFRNITVELLRPQAAVTNLCEDAVAGVEQLCPSARLLRDGGALERPAFETDQLRVGLLTLEPGTRVEVGGRSRRVWYIALTATELPRLERADRQGPAGRSRSAAAAGPAWRGGVWLAPAEGRWVLSNPGRRTIRLLEVRER